MRRTHAVSSSPGRSAACSAPSSASCDAAPPLRGGTHYDRDARVDSDLASRLLCAQSYEKCSNPPTKKREEPYILTGAFYGLSMLFPLSLIFLLGCLILVTVIRNRMLMQSFWRLIALALTPGGYDPQHRPIGTSVARFREALSKSPNPVVSSWGNSRMWVLIMIGEGMVAFPLMWFVYRFSPLYGLYSDRPASNRQSPNKRRYYCVPFLVT
jgi:hypothetical protein